MDDNIILALFIFGFIGIVALIVRKVNQIAAKRKAEYDAEMTRQREVTRQWRERMYEKSKTEAAQYTAPAKKRTLVKREEPARTSYAYTTQPVQLSSNLLSDIADVAMIANTVRHWNDNTDTERSVGVSSSTREIGYDSSDEPSRSSSWSSSSSSSDSWSSSDSGPSSDW